MLQSPVHDAEMSPTSVDTTHRVWIATTNENIKHVKTTLEKANIYDKTSKIQKVVSNADEHFIACNGKISLSKYHSLIPTTVLKSSAEDTIPASLQRSLSSLSLGSQEYALFMAEQPFREHVESSRSSNPISRVAQLWLEQLRRYSGPEIQHIIQAESWSYQIYHPLLLLGPSSFGSDTWRTLFNDKTVIDEFSVLYSMMCSVSGCTHIAINGRILPEVESSVSSQDSVINVLRSPSCLVPLHGKFGSRTDVASRTTLEESLWASATQNGIHQIFAPIHTMFSRGNIKEKARILRLAQQETESYSAIDLYAGIGYFAFSYAKGGAAVVLGWEINEWSVEGFRRGASKNGWGVKVYNGGEPSVNSLRSWLDSRNGHESSSPKLAIFAESNEAAPRQMEILRNVMPPVRHVNCGYLPSSSESWTLAIRCLDRNRGGCIHVHENVRAKYIEARGLEIQDIFETLLEKHLGDTSMTLQCRHTERVKSYAPGVVHCVFDIYVSREIGGL